MNSLRNRRDTCAICSRLWANNNDGQCRNRCEKYLFKFLSELYEKLDDEIKIDAHFADSIFTDEDNLNRASYLGLTLMHVNVLGVNTNESEPTNTVLTLPYDELPALRICEILLKRGASSNSETVYEMRPLHIAIRRQWIKVSQLLLQAGADPNAREQDIYASRPIDIAVKDNDIEAVELLHAYHASLDGLKSLFHRSPLTEAFSRGYFEIFQLLLELGVKPEMQVDRSMCRSFGERLFETGPKGRRHFIQLLYDHGGDIESQFRLHAMRIEPDGINYHHPEFRFAFDAICIAHLDPTIFKSWLCQTRSLKELCRLTIRRHCSHYHLSRLASHELFNRQLFNYVLFNRTPSRFESSEPFEIKQA